MGFKKFKEKNKKTLIIIHKILLIIIFTLPTIYILIQFFLLLKGLGNGHKYFAPGPIREFFNSLE